MYGYGGTKPFHQMRMDVWCCTPLQFVCPSTQTLAKRSCWPCPSEQPGFCLWHPAKFSGQSNWKVVEPTPCPSYCEITVSKQNYTHESQWYATTHKLTWHDDMPHVPTLQSIHTLSVVIFATASATKSSTLRLMLLNLQWNDLTMQPRHHQVCSMLRPVGWVEFQKEILWLNHWGLERLPNHLCHGNKLDLKNHWQFPWDELWCLFIAFEICVYITTHHCAAKIKDHAQFVNTPTRANLNTTLHVSAPCGSNPH